MIGSDADVTMLAEYNTWPRLTAYQERQSEDVFHCLGKVLVVHDQL